MSATEQTTRTLRKGKSLTVLVYCIDDPAMQPCQVILAQKMLLGVQAEDGSAEHQLNPRPNILLTLTRCLEEPRSELRRKLMWV